MTPNFLMCPGDLPRPARADRPLEQKAHPRLWERRQLVKSCPLQPYGTKGIKVGRKEEVRAQGAHALPFPRNCSNPSPTDLPTRKKHDAVPLLLLNADPLAQIIGTETVADVIIDYCRCLCPPGLWSHC